MKKLFMSLLVLGTMASAFAGENFRSVISYKNAYGEFSDLRVGVELVDRAISIGCTSMPKVTTKVSQSGTSGYYDVSFTLPDTFFCKYKPVILQGTFRCFKEVGCVNQAYPVSIFFSAKGGVDYEQLPNDKYGFEKVLSFPKKDPFSLVQVILTNDLRNERNLFQFVVQPK